VQTSFEVFALPNKQTEGFRGAARIILSLPGKKALVQEDQQVVLVVRTGVVNCLIAVYIHIQLLWSRC
jgi:hypothetical protein